MTAEAPPPATDWPASCGAAAGREGGGAEQGADCLPASPSPAPPRQPRKHGAPILAPRELGSRRRTEHAQQGPAREASAGAPSAGAAVRAAAPRGSGQRTAAPRRSGEQGRCRRPAGRAGAGPGSLGHRAPRRAGRGRQGHSSLGAHFALPLSRWRGQRAAMEEPARGRRPEAQGRPREGRMRPRPLERVLQPTRPLLRLNDTLRLGGTWPGGRRGRTAKGRGRGYLNLNRDRKEN